MKKVKVGLIGFGTVGSGVAYVLTRRRAQLRELAGVDIELKYICDKDVASNRGFPIDKKLLTKDVNKILKNPEIDIVIELIGGIHPAYEFVMAALKNGKHVATANKALLAEKGVEIFKAAKKHGKEVRFEASVGGGIPIIKALREGLVSNKINEIYGIINGTCNYILSRMTDEGCDFKMALKAAQKRGIAEANPTLDVTGVDSAHKLIVLAGLSFGVFARMKQVYCDGILSLEPCDIQYAKEMGYTVKLLAIAKRQGEKIEMRVHPTLVPNEHLLANVKDVYNAIYVKGDLIGKNLFYGEGAGRFPTASAAVSDVVDISKLIGNTGACCKPAPLKIISNGCSNGVSKIKKVEEIESRYYFRFTVLDRPGVLAKIAGILGKHNISIATVSQKEWHHKNIVPVVIMTHMALERNMQRAMTLIDRLPVVKKKTVVMRVEAL